MKNKINTALNKDIFRTIKKTWPRFLAILLMTALGATVYIGLKSTGPNLKQSLLNKAEKHQMYHFKISSYADLSEKDIDIVKEWNKNAQVEKSFSSDFKIKDSDEYLKIYSNNKEINKFIAIKGSLPKKKGEIAIDHIAYKDKKYKLGDSLTLDYLDPNEEKALSSDSFTIVGFVESMDYLMTSRGNSGINSSNSTYYGLVAKEEWENHNPRELLVKIPELNKVYSGNKDYKNKEKKLVDELKDLFKNRPKEIEEELKKDILSSIQEGEKEIEASKNKLSKAEGELEDAKKQIEKSKIKYRDGKKDFEKKISQAKDDVREGENNLDIAKYKLGDANDKFNKNKEKFLQDMDFAEKQIDKGKSEIDLARQKLDENQKEYKVNLDNYQKEWKSYKKQEEELNNKETKVSKLKEDILDINNLIAKLEEEMSKLDNFSQPVDQINDLEQVKESLKELHRQKEELEKIYNQEKVKIDEGKIKLDLEKEKLMAWKSELTKAEKSLSKAEDSYNSQEKEFFKKEKDLNQARIKGEDELKKTWSTITESKNKIINSEKKLIANKNQLDKKEKDGLLSLTNNKKSIDRAEKEYEKNLKLFQIENKEALNKIKDAEKNLIQSKEKSKNIKIPNYPIGGRYNDFLFNTYIDEANSIDTMSYIFTTMFYAVAILVTLTTILRMVDTERIQIGTLKALGYKKNQIARKYLFYGLSSSMLGTLIGVFLGYKGLMPPIFNAYTASTTLSSHNFILNPLFILAAFAISGLTIGLAAYFSVRKSLKENAANLMRPKPPKKSKRLFLENFPFIWGKLSFLQKVTLRNFSRNKLRMWMTILGVAGSSSLIAMGFGIKSSVEGIGEKQFNDIYQYDLQIIYDDSSDINNITSKLNTDKYIKTISYPVSIENKKGFLEDVNIIASDEPIEDYIKLQDRKSKEKYKLNKDDFIISEKLSQTSGKTIGDQLNLIDQYGMKHPIKITNITEQYSGHQAYLSKKLFKEKIDSQIDYNSLLIMSDDWTNKDIEKIANNIKNEENVIKAIPIIDLDKMLGDLVESLDIIVLVIILISSILTFVVIFNLTNINVSERRRELATIKVLGFRPAEMSSYIFRETIILSFIGIFLGFFLGKIMHLAIVIALSPSAILLDPEMNKFGFLASFIIVSIFTAIVLLVINRDIKKIDMVEALKSVD